MLGVIYDYIETYVWFPLFHKMGVNPTYSFGLNAETLTLSNVLSMITCFILGSVIIFAVCCFVRWFIRSISGLIK